MINSALKLPPAEAKPLLHDLSAQVRYLATAKIRVPATELTQSKAAVVSYVQQRPDSEAAQNLALQLVSYDSSVHSGFVTGAALPDCLADGNWHSSEAGTDDDGIPYLILEVGDCKLDLSNSEHTRSVLRPALDHIVNLPKNNRFQVRVRMKDGVLEYTGGDIEPIAQVIAVNSRLHFAEAKEPTTISSNLLLAALRSAPGSLRFLNQQAT